MFGRFLPARLGVLFALAFLAVFPTGQASARCGYPDSIDPLLAELFTVAWDERAAARVETAGLERALGSWPATNAIGDAPAEMRILMDRLRGQTRVILSLGRVRDPEVLRADLRRINTLINERCIAMQNAALGGQSNQPAASPELGGGNLVALPIRRNASSLRQVGLYLVASISLIFLLISLDQIYRWLFSLRFNRKSCRIAARLDLGEVVVPGKLTILGFKGCRFVPDEVRDLGQIGRLAPRVEPRVIVDGYAVPSIVGEVTESYVVVFFEMPISLAMHSEIISNSVVTPHYVPLKRSRQNVPPPSIDRAPRAAYRLA